MSFWSMNASATLAKNRTEDPIVPISVLCPLEVDNHTGMGEISESTRRGLQLIYPQFFGIITTTPEKGYPAASHISPVSVPFWGLKIEPGSDRTILKAPKIGREL